MSPDAVKGASRTTRLVAIWSHDGGSAQLTENRGDVGGGGGRSRGSRHRV